MVWAMDLPLERLESATARHVLLVLANYADQEGRHAFPSVSTIARQTGLTVRSIRQTIAGLIEGGIIRPGNQAIVAAHIDRADRRPVVYDLCITGVHVIHPAATGGISRPDGVNLEAGRGEPRSPNPPLPVSRSVAPAVARAVVDKVERQRQPQQPPEPSGRQPPAADVIAAFTPEKVAEPEVARRAMEEIAKSFGRKAQA